MVRRRAKGLLCGASLVGLLAGCSAAADADRPPEGREFRPSERLERLQAVPLDSDDTGLVRDFDMLGDTIYLLDALGRVLVVERRDDHLHLAGEFGRKGAGPGEFLQATSLAVAGDEVMVVDGTRLQFFSRSGAPLGLKWLDMPCPMMLPAIAPATSGMFLYGNCLESGYVTDTMHAVLAWAADTSTWDVIIRTPRFTRDGSFGSVFGARSLLTTGTEGLHAFGGGEQNCIWTVADPGGRPSAVESCATADVLYSADPPPGLEDRMRAAAATGMKMKWPESLPVYTDRFVAPDVVLFRPFTSDSLVLQLAAPASVDLAVAPLNGLIGCKAAGCLWLFDLEDVPHLIVLDRSRIEHLMDQESKR